MWSDTEIMELLEEYLSNNKKDSLHLLVPELIPEKYRVLPKSGIAYRGIQISKSGFKSITTSKPLTVKVPYYLGVTSSISNAKEFAQGLMGNDYKRRKETMVGVVYKVRIKPEDLVICVSAFIRKSNLPSDVRRHFGGENEYLVKTDYDDENYGLISKDTLVKMTERVFTFA